MTTRRTFLARGSATVAAASLGLHRTGPRRPVTGGALDATPRVETDPAVRALALRAVDAAKSAGATYADVRLTRTLHQWCASGAPRRETRDKNSEAYAVGVRALVNGFWGFAASPYWTPDEVAQLARDAVAQASNNALGTTRPAELGTLPVANGSWRTPVRIDPFTVPIEEKEEFLASISNLAQQYYHGAAAYPRSSIGQWVQAGFTRQERAVATSEGAYFTQTTYESEGDFKLGLKEVPRGPGYTSVSSQGLGLQSLGWEMFLDANIPSQFPQLVADIEALWRLTAKAGDIGKYDVVFDAVSVAALIAGTIGNATQLDRALGFEANAGGTSYLDDPLAMLGTYDYKAPLLTVTANRSARSSLATVKWDDEGVEPDDFTLIKDGVLVDYQTTREQAGWLKEYYQKAGKPVHSHGCAAADDALSITMQHTPNLVMTPATDDIGFDDLVRDTKKGLAVLRSGVDTDWQGRTGVGTLLEIREIVNGRLGPVVSGLDFMFSSAELWKNLVAIGGPASVVSVARADAKGQPGQSTHYTVSAVPAKVTNVTFINPARRA